jgi:hypothetical protein
MVKIPEEWVKRQDIQATVENAVSKVLRQSQRLAAVVLLWEEWHRTPEGWNLVLSRFKSYSNTKSELFRPDIDELLKLIGRASNPAWLTFHALVEQIRRTSGGLA